MKIDKKAINYYYSFFEVSKELNQKQFYEFNMAIYKVMFFEVHIDTVEFKDSMLNILWKSVKHSLQASIKGYCDKKSIPYNDIFTPLSNPLSNKNNEEEKEKEKEEVQVQVQEEYKGKLNLSLNSKIELKLQEVSPLINLQAFNEWMDYKKYKSIAPITKTINFLIKYGFVTQQQIIDNSIMNNYKGLFEPKQQTKSFNTPTMQQLNTDVNIWDAIEAQTDRGAING